MTLFKYYPMWRFTYPKLTGNRWSIGKRIKDIVGLEPVLIVDIVEETIIEFDKALNEKQKAKLEHLILGHKGLPPEETQVAIIKDIWEVFEHFKKELDLPELTMYYSSDTDKTSENTNQIELHHPTPLSDKQKAKLAQVYAALITLK